MEEDLVEVELARVVIQEKNDHQLIHLRERDGERSFPIVIGFAEALEIHRKVQNVRPERPLTHDLIGRILYELGYRLARVVVNKLEHNTFFALLDLERDGEVHLIDCRPSDGIALAVQLGAPIYVAREVFDAVAPG